MIQQYFDLSPEERDELRILATRIKPIVKMSYFVSKLKKGIEEKKVEKNGYEHTVTTFQVEFVERKTPANVSELGVGGHETFFAYIKAGTRIFDTTFNWDPKFLCKAPKLVKLGQITTEHTYGYYGLFKPSEAEVLAQIPKELRNQVNAYEIFLKNPTDLDGSFTEDGKYHRAQVNLFKLDEGEEEPKKVQDYYGRIRRSLEKIL